MDFTYRHADMERDVSSPFPFPFSFHVADMKREFAALEPNIYRTAVELQLDYDHLRRSYCVWNHLNQHNKVNLLHCHYNFILRPSSQYLPPVILFVSVLHEPSQLGNGYCCVFLHGMDVIFDAATFLIMLTIAHHTEIFTVLVHCICFVMLIQVPEFKG